MLLSLFLTFAKIGMFTFGGGYAMIPLIEHACVEQKGWITHDDMMTVTVIAESTPGPIAINCATFVGYRKKGLQGALAATLGMALPSFVIIYLISMFLDSFLEITWVASAFKGIRIAVGILIIDAAIKMTRKMQKKPLSRAIMLCSCAVMLLVNFLSLRLSPISLMIVAALISLAIFQVQGAQEAPGATDASKATGTQKTPEIAKSPGTPEVEESTDEKGGGKS